VLVAGTFSGSLRASDRVVTSAGESDGFALSLDAAGKPRWLMRMGGNSQDAIIGIAQRGDRIALAGSFSPGAEIRGHALASYDERARFADAFAAELDVHGEFVWATPFGGRADDTVVGVALDTRGRTLAAGSSRDVVVVGSKKVSTRGPADALVSVFAPDGVVDRAQLLNGTDFDGASAIAAVDDRIVVGGFFSGEITLGSRTLRAGGGDDSFIALVDASGQVTASWQVGGEGREEVIGLVAIPGGFVAGVAHTTAAAIDGGPPLASPADPLTGAALIVRGVTP
jgi:hypothetical protein